MDEPRAHYTEWSKSERERQIWYINTYIWNLEGRYWRSYIQGSNGDTENRLLDSVGEGRAEWPERRALKHVHYCMQNGWPVPVPAWSQTPRACALWQPGGMVGEGGVSGVQDQGTDVGLWLIHLDVWQKPSQYCKVIIL